MKANRIVRRGQLKLKASLADQAFKAGVQLGVELAQKRITTAAFHLTYEAQP